MRHHVRVLGIISLLCFLCLPLAGADDIATKGKDVLAKYKDVVITIKLVIKEGMSYAGKDTNKSESKMEVIGTVIDANGLTVVSLSATDPAGMFGEFMMGEGDDDSKFKIQTEVTDVKLIMPDGKEIPAKIVLRDKDLDLAFIQPINKLDKPMVFADLKNAAKPGILDQVIVLNRLGKVANRMPQVSLDRVEAIIEKPRTFYIPGRSMNEGGLGSPTFSEDQKIVGILVLKITKTEGRGGAAMLFGGSGGMGIMPVILPADDILEAASQVPSTDKKADTETKK